jgi:phytoene dehydrogenase-like protein
MSLMPPTVVEDLRLREHGYRVVPMGPSFAPFDDGRALLLTGDPAEDHTEVAAFSPADADAMVRFTAWLAGVGDILAPLLLRTPPGSARGAPATCWTSCASPGGCAGWTCAAVPTPCGCSR